MSRIWIWLALQLTLADCFSFHQPNATQVIRANPVIEAIIPTTSGQIGINPVTLDIGDAETFVGSVYGTDTQYITTVVVSSITYTNWAGSNPSYLSAIGTSTVYAAIATATAATNDQKIGDVSIIIPKGLADALQGVGEKASKDCGSSITKRDIIERQQTDEKPLACLIQKVVDFSETFDAFIPADQLKSFPTTVAADAPVILIDALTTANNQKRGASLLIGLASVTALLVSWYAENISSAPGGVGLNGKINMPTNAFGKPRCVGTETSRPSSILCRNPECLGEDLRCTAENEHKRCPCLTTKPNGSPAYIMNYDWVQGQQQYLLDVYNQAIIDPNPTGPCVAVGSRFDPQMLRILPLGASIVWGLQSPSGNGFRQYLRQMLIDNGANVNMVGTLQHGPMGDNDVEGWPGFRIDQVSDRSNNAIPQQPNVVLIHAGTNDIAQGWQLDTADQRLGALVDKLLDQIPGTVVMVSTLIPNRNSTKEGWILPLNEKIVAMVNSKAQQGKYVQLVDMHSEVTPEMINRRDGTHPTEYGYQTMARIWYQGFQDVYSKCWFTRPAHVEGLDDSKTAGPGRNCGVSGNLPAPVPIMRGPGVNDSNYHHIGEWGVTLQIYPHRSGRATYGIDVFHWANIDGDGTDEVVHWSGGILGVGKDEDDVGHANVFKTTTFTVSSPNFPCLPVKFMVGDLDGDGRADAICLSDDGELSAWKNDIGSDPWIPNWISLGVIKSAEPGFSYDRIRLADIDGDGRLDYLAISLSGTVTGWRNTATSANSPSWSPMGEIWTGANPGEIAGIRFIDINGDGRADYVWVSNSGQAYTAINQRGFDLTARPVWLPLKLTHTGAGQDVTDRRQVMFGKIYEPVNNKYPDYDASGADYSVIVSHNELVGLDQGLNPHVPVRYLRNKGKGGARPKGDGVEFCDMRGAGSDDLVWINKNGNVSFYGNAHGLPGWQRYFVVYEGGSLASMDGKSRKDIHVADIDGDGRCEIVIVDNKANSFHVIHNDYDHETDTFAWSDHGTITGVYCGSNGPGMFDLSFRFADISGNGLADLLCIDPHGKVDVYYNRNGVSYESGGRIWQGKGEERANVRFADVNGDGHADHIILDAITGAASVSYYLGTGVNGVGSHWSPAVVAFPGGIMRGETVKFANLNGYGRADYINIHPQTAAGTVVYNVCDG